VTPVPRPVILVVAPEPRTLEGLQGDLDRRFGRDYAVHGASTAAEGLAALSRLTSRSHEAALVIADEDLTDLPPTEFLARVRGLSPAAKRILLISRGDWSAAHPVVSAMALGQIDFHLFKPWQPLERILYPAMAEFLAAWDKTQEPPDVAMRIVGQQWAAASHRLRDVLTRIGLPFWFYDVDTAEGAALLAEAGRDRSRLPVVVYLDGTVLVEPSHAEVMATLGVTTTVDADSCDVVVIGAGPSGLAAAVTASSEGLDTVVLESDVPGGQAGTSSLIRNYLGFHRGISGDDLTNRGVEQAWLFGAQFVLSEAVTSMCAEGDVRVVRTASGSEIRAKAVVVATGVSWRRLGVAAVERLLGAGVFYGAAGAEARAMRDKDVFVVGAGNSAGQAALHLARYARSVTILVRGEALKTTMSDYLVTEIEQSPVVDVRVRTEVADAHGGMHLESLTLRTSGAAADVEVPAAALFVMIGAHPRTEWLAETLERDSQGYLLTGTDLVSDGGRPVGWPLTRAPYLLETSIPGVFAVGDVRHGSVKRVASAVGAGAIAMQLVHTYLEYLRSNAAGDRHETPGRDDRAE
jgi:thioredoxin reductase (NADPH)